MDASLLDDHQAVVAHVNDLRASQPPEIGEEVGGCELVCREEAEVDRLPMPETEGEDGAAVEHELVENVTERGP